MDDISFLKVKLKKDIQIRNSIVLLIVGLAIFISYKFYFKFTANIRKTIPSGF